MQLSNQKSHHMIIQSLHLSGRQISRILALPVPSCVTLGKLIHLSVPNLFNM